MTRKKKNYLNEPAIVLLIRQTNRINQLVIILKGTKFQEKKFRIKLFWLRLVTDIMNEYKTNPNLLYESISFF